MYEYAASKNMKRDTPNLVILVHFGTLKSEDCSFNCRPIMSLYNNRTEHQLQ